MWNRESDFEKEVEKQYARQLNGEYGKQPSIVPLLFIIGIICLVLLFVNFLTVGVGKGTTNSSQLNNQQSTYTKGSNTYEPNIPENVERGLTGDWSSQ